MAKVLVTLLGKAVNNYRKANYHFANNEIANSRFFGLELAKRLQPDKLLILGTTGSMWDSLLLETDLAQQSDFDDTLLNLGESAQADQVDQKELDKLAVALSKLLGYQCILQLIPYGKNQHEQLTTLQTLVQHFEKADTAFLDVTHGLRHLPMLVQQSALLLQSLKQVNIQAIYYGALDLTDSNTGLTPVMQLNGLLEIDRWTQALDIYDRTGDYSVFVSVLKTIGIQSSTLDYLEDAVFFEQTNRVSQAGGRLKDFLKALEKEENNLSSFSRLFIPSLKERFTWVYENKLYQRQSAVARQALEHGNFIRASIYGFEAFITYLVQQDRRESANYKDRQEAKERYEHNQPRETWYSYKLLRGLRNQLAHHSDSGMREIQQAITNKQTLTQKLTELFDTLLPEQGE